jgi:DNA replication protein DnaC
MINFYQENPAASLFAYSKGGESYGVGKSLIGWMLYQEAIESGRTAYVYNCADWMNEIREYQFKQDELPPCSAADFANNWSNLTQRKLFVLDEMDKVRASAFAAEQLSLLLDNIYRYRHQLVVCCNVTVSELQNHWAEAGGGYGGNIIRRIRQHHGIVEWEF